MMVESYIVRFNLKDNEGDRFNEIDARREQLLKRIDSTNKQDCINFGIQMSEEFPEIENFRLDTEFVRIDR